TGAGGATAPSGVPAGFPAGMQLPDMDEALRHRELNQKLKAAGVEAPAVISAIRRIQDDPISGAVKCEVDVTIKPPNGEAYAATIKQSILPAWLDTLNPGDAVSIKYDPDSPTSALMYGNI
ncbi:MAG TPA: hypothetical protein VEJ44_00390, partial [Acidimicrobiales bacterium]|nr:hypothetical protein [Acidimicrobiales bacterium]